MFDNTMLGYALCIFVVRLLTVGESARRHNPWYCHRATLSGGKERGGGGGWGVYWSIRGAFSLLSLKRRNLY